MANTVTDIMPKILAQGLLALREMLAIARNVNGSYSSEAAQKGENVQIPVSSAVTAVDVTAAAVPPTPGDTTISNVTLALDRWRKSTPFHLTDKEMSEIAIKQHFVPLQVSEAVRSLANDVNGYIHDQYVEVPNAVLNGETNIAADTNGTPFTSSFVGASAATVQAATQARSELNRLRAPLENRRFVLDFDAGAAALELSNFNEADKTGERNVIIEGEMGRKFGFDFFEDAQVRTHTVGTISDGTDRSALVDGAVAAGATTMNLDETTLTGTLVKGDIFTVANVEGTFTVTNDPSITASGNAFTGVTFTPAAPTGGFADNAAVQVMGTHVVNLAFHRDAIAFAQRPLARAGTDLPGRFFQQATDPLTGISLRLEVLPEYKQTAWEFDILYGAKVIRPELAVRVPG